MASAADREIMFVITVAAIAVTTSAVVAQAKTCRE